MPFFLGGSSGFGCSSGALLLLSVEASASRPAPMGMMPRVEKITTLWRVMEPNHPTLPASLVARLPIRSASYDA